MIERTFTALLEPAGTSAELHNAALLEVFAHPARFAALIDEGHPQPLVGLVAELLTEADAAGSSAPGSTRAPPRSRSSPGRSSPRSRPRPSAPTRRGR